MAHEDIDLDLFPVRLSTGKWALSLQKGSRVQFGHEGMSMAARSSVLSILYRTLSASASDKNNVTTQIWRFKGSSAITTVLLQSRCQRRNVKGIDEPYFSVACFSCGTVSRSKTLKTPSFRDTSILTSWYCSPEPKARFGLIPR
jgi:hypothetical protein